MQHSIAGEQDVTVFLPFFFFLPELHVYSLGIHLSELFKMDKGT